MPQLAGVAGAFVLAFVVLCSTVYSLQKVSDKQYKDAQQEELIRTVHKLEHELSAPFGSSTDLTAASPLPSAKAVELARLIGQDDGPYAQALKATAERRYEDARSFFGQAEATAPDLRALYIARANTEGYAGAFGDQIQWLRKALSLKADDSELLIKLGVAMMAMGKFSDAEGPLGLVQSSPDQSAATLAQTDLACAYLQQGNSEKARSLNDAALAAAEEKWGPDDPRVAVLLANAAGIQDSLGNGSKAEEFFLRALKIEREDSCPGGAERAWTLNGLGAHYHRVGKFTQAEKALSESVVLAEKCTVESLRLACFLADLAPLYFDLQRYPEAEPRFKQALSLAGQSGTDRIRILKGYDALLRKTGRAAEAVTVEDELAVLEGHAPLKAPALILPPPQRGT
jgi:tetratricopeptide (TPR) repeat protein